MKDQKWRYKKIIQNFDKKEDSKQEKASKKSDIQLQVAALLEILNENQKDKNLYKVLELHNYKYK